VEYVHIKQLHNTYNISDTMDDHKESKEIQLTESVASDFIEDDFELDKRVPALYEKLMAERSGRSSYRGKLTPERYEAIIRYIRAGALISHAANAVGVDDNTVYRWVKQGEKDPDSIYGLFEEDYRRAKSAAILRNIMIVQRAANDDWKAAVQMLKFLDKDNFSNTSTIKTEISGPGGNPISTKIIISDEEIQKLAIVQQVIEEQNKIIIDADFRNVSDGPKPEPEDEDDMDDVIYPEE
jgi:transposase-like protein